MLRDANRSVDSAITLSKLYTNALMMVFNNRGHMSGLRGGVHHGSNRLWSTRDGTHIDTSGENVTKVKSAPREISLQTFNTGGHIHLNDSDGQSDISKLKSHDVGPQGLDKASSLGIRIGNMNFESYFFGEVLR
ncbi:hypothetical protein TRAPUB_1236 [Trametes pubescens]|uniref:Uncharacterized protein n=1 Tax=Trametes pubescens TaxID=154538 RepID=A0A1M2VJQ7_TRAPU|nr:hypothetical protein TRAPUB_1236 [Trametes pubescens]